MPEARLSGVQLDDTDKLAVSLYGKGTAVGDTGLLLSSAGRPSVVMGSIVTPGDNASNVQLAWRADNDSGYYGAGVYPYRYNGSTWDPVRGNTHLTLLASTARTSTTNSSDQTNHNARGVIAFLDITAVPGVDTVTLLIQGKDPVSGNYRTLAASAAKDATGTYYVVCYPGATDVGNKTDGKNDLPLPRTWRVQVTHSGSGSFTYSVSASLIL